MTSQKTSAWEAIAHLESLKEIVYMNEIILDCKPF